MPGYLKWHGISPAVEKLEYRAWLYDTCLRPYLNLKREPSDGELLDDEWWAQWSFNDFGLYRKANKKEVGQ